MPLVVASGSKLHGWNPLAQGALFFDDFTGSAVDSAKWTVYNRIGDLANAEVHGVIPANVSVVSSILSIVSKHETISIGDSQTAPQNVDYTSGQIAQATAPFLYGTIEVRAKAPGGTGLWPAIWMLGFEWQESQPDTANTPGHDWPNDGWCEIDIAEFWQNARDSVGVNVHFNSAGVLSEPGLPFDATSRFMVYRLQWSAGSLIWSVDAEDGVGWRELHTSANAPDVAMYLIISTAIGGSGGGTPNSATFPQTFEIDYVRVTQ